MNPEISDRAQSRRSNFRWRILPTMFCGFFGIFGTLGAVGKAGMMVFGYVRFGPIAPDPETPSLNMIALTTVNVLEVVAGLCAAIVALFACRLRWRAEWRLAGLLTVIVVGTLLASKYLETRI